MFFSNANFQYVRMQILTAEDSTRHYMGKLYQHFAPAVEARSLLDNLWIVELRDLLNRPRLSSDSHLRKLNQLLVHLKFRLAKKCLMSIIDYNALNIDTDFSFILAFKVKQSILTIAIKGVFIIFFLFSNISSENLLVSSFIRIISIKEVVGF